MTEKKEQKLQTVLAIAFHDFEKGLNTHASFKVGNQATGQDLVQDTFVKTWGYLVKGGKIEIMKAFLYHVLNNLIVDQYRKHKTTSLDAMLEKGFEPTAGDDFKHLRDILDGSKAILLILRLPKKYQKIMRMRYMEDLTLKEMSLITGQTRNAIAVQAHRGLEILRTLYKK